MHKLRKKNSEQLKAKFTSAKTLTGHLRTSMNDARNTYELRFSHKYHERPEFHTWKM